MTNLNEEAIIGFYQECGVISDVARRFGVSRQTVRNLLRKNGITKPIFGGQTDDAIQEESRSLPTKGKIKRYILTCAQNNTKVWDKWWENLLALKKHYNAELLISTFTYNKSMYFYQSKRTTHSLDDLKNKIWYDPRILEYACDHRVELAPGLIFCGEMNIMPTADKPLSDLKTYTGPSNGIFPHVKVAMESVATVGALTPAKFNYTTGTVTKRNYITKKAGLKASFHHVYGALLVEVNSDGEYWIRQLIANKQGKVQDLDVIADNGNITTGNRVEAINWGDVHVEETNSDVKEGSWGKGGMLDELKPKYQFMHDTMSMSSRNHHDKDNHHALFEKYVTGRDSVEQELSDVVKFLDETSYRSWCKTIVVDSNHDRALERWLKEADHKKDHVNAILYLQLELAKRIAIKEQIKDFHLLEYACKGLGLKNNIHFLKNDDFVICRDSTGGIQCGLHGDRGPNGTRGSSHSLSKIGCKANIGHSHSAGIIDGLYTAGTCTDRKLSYTSGPSSWSQSDIVTYQTGKRAIITKIRGKYRA